VIQELNLKRYVLVGHSMGGKVAQLMASRRPTGLAGLVLVAPSPPSPMALPLQAREMMAGAYASRETVEATIDNVLTAKPRSAEDREQVIADSLRCAPPAKFAWPKATSQEDITGRGRQDQRAHRADDRERSTSKFASGRPAPSRRFRRSFSRHVGANWLERLPSRMDRTPPCLRPSPLMK
jgi:pimeloyl-ACP methyl ester carboxylesterase